MRDDKIKKELKEMKTKLPPSIIRLIDNNETKLIPKQEYYLIYKLLNENSSNINILNDEPEMRKVPDKLFKKLIKLKKKKERQRLQEEQAKKAEEEEARRKAEADRIRKIEEKKRKAKIEKEQKQKLAEEKKRKLEEERKRKAEEDKKRKAEEERKKKEQATLKADKERLATKLQALVRGKAARRKAEARRKAAQEKAEEEQAKQTAENLKELLSKEEMSINDAMKYFDEDVKRENIAHDFIIIEVIQAQEESKGGKKPAKKPKRRANKTKRAKKSNKKKRKPKRKTLRKIKKIIFR